MQRFLDPRVLAGINGLDLIAKTVVDGFVTGLHRSPDCSGSAQILLDPLPHLRNLLCYGI